MGAACTSASQVAPDSIVSVNRTGQQHLKNLKIDTEYRNEDHADKDV
jgi:DNA-binding protein YbaB